MNKPAKKGFRSPADFVAAANNLPEEHLAINPAGKPVEALTSPAEATTPAQAATSTPPLPPAAQAAKDAALAEALPELSAQPAAATAANSQDKPARKPKVDGRAEKPPTSDAQPHTHKRATDAPKEPPAPAEPAPWEVESPDSIVGYNFRMSRALHAKLAWVADNVPKHRSIQVALEKAVTGYVDALIAKHYSPDAEA